MKCGMFACSRQDKASRQTRKQILLALFRTACRTITHCMFNRAWCAGNDYDKAPETKQLQSSTMENSPFGRLAPELRNKIWALAVKKVRSLV